MLKVLLIDNDDTQLEIYSLALSPHFHIASCKNFIDAQALMEHETFHIVLCEWEIGGITASQLKKLFIAQGGYTFPVVVVVSNDARDSSMMAAFNGGATFYFSKPYKVIQFTENLLTLKDQIERFQQVESKIKSTEKVKQSAITEKNVYEMGMSILAGLTHDESLEEVATKILRSFRIYGIQAAVQFRPRGDVLTYDADLTSGDDNLQGVFSLLSKQGLVYCFGQRVMFNHGNMSVLVKHIHDDDPNHRQTVIAMISKLVPAVSCIASRVMQKSALSSTYSDFYHVKRRLNQGVNALARQHDVIVDNFCDTLESRKEKLALTLEQEAELVDALKDTLQTVHEHRERLIDIEALMTGVSERLEKRIQLSGELGWQNSKRQWMKH